MNTILSQKEWERVGKLNGWHKTSQLFSNFDYLTLGPTPSAEQCCQLGTHDSSLNKMEVAAFIKQLQRLFPGETPNAYFKPQREDHEFGTYYEASIKYNENDEQARNFAFNVDSNIPPKWDEQARAELQTQGYFDLLKVKREKQANKDSFTKTAQDAIQDTIQDGSPERAIEDIKELLAKEEDFKQHNAPIPDMPEATPEDIDEGYGRGMSSNDFVESLNPVWIDVQYKQDTAYGTAYADFEVYFHGNYEPSSVNAGRSKKAFIASFQEAEAKRFVELCNQNAIELSIGGLAKEKLQNTAT